MVTIRRQLEVSCMPKAGRLDLSDQEFELYPEVCESHQRILGKEMLFLILNLIC